MRHPFTLAVTLALIAPALAQAQTVPTQTAPAQPAPAAAQPTSSAAPLQATVQSVVVVGTTDLLANMVKATLSVQEGAALSSVNPRQVEQEVLATGYFRSAMADLRTVNGQDVLYITVVSNPEIKSVDASGMSFLPADGFKQSIADQLNIAPGVTLNTQRIDQAKLALAQNYRQQGFPFTPNISTKVTTNTDGTASISFTVDETAPIKRIEVVGATLLPAAQVSDIFKPLYNAKKFTTPAFLAAADALQKAYNDAGYLQAGLDPAGVSLENGVLHIKIIEGKVTAIDSSALGETKSALQTRVGQPLSLEQLKADVRTLANETGQPVGFALQADPSDPASVTVMFGSADMASGPVKTIQFVGNTKVSTAALQAALHTKVGDTYSPQLAQDDFAALRELYRKAGYEISTRDAISYEDGTLTFNIREVRVVGYKIAWQGTHKTKDRIILRELPPAGGLFNLGDLRDSLGRISRLGFVTITGENVESNDAQNPENVTYVVQLAEQKSGIPVNLALSYDTLAGGWGGQVGYDNNNVFGLAHHFGVQVGAQQNEAGQKWNGSLNYTIPWLDLNFGDFRQKRTYASFNLYSNVGANNSLLDTNRADTGRDYTVRTTGFSLSLGRNITPNLSASVGTSFNYKTYYLEPMQSGEYSNLSDAEATAALPKENLTTRFDAGLGFDNTDDAEFPGQGQRASLSAGYNFGRSGSSPLGWTDMQTGASKYFGFGGKYTHPLGNETYKNVFAVRANYGASFGNYPAGTGYYIGGSSASPATELRGLNDGQLFGTSYLTSSAEYRHDFGLNSSFAQGLYGVLWGDYGGVWQPGGTYKDAYGVGAGVQLNLGINGSRLFNLRFDYGWSPQRADTAGNSQGGRFMFRIGNFW